MRAVFLDRDGVINADRDDYVKNTRELVIYPFAPAAIRAINDAGWKVFIVSNQQGVAKGIISEVDLHGIEVEIRRQVEDAGAKIEAFYYCKHLASDSCGCRKPQPGLILRAAREHSIDLADSIMVGDTQRDILAGKAAGCRWTIVVLTGKLTLDDIHDWDSKPDFVAENLEEAAAIIARL